MSILATITRATAGHVLWNGAEIARQPDVLRRVLGYLRFRNLLSELLRCRACPGGVAWLGGQRRHA
ncbi:MAG TPA: hypothetical protein VGL22_18315 [Terracidiphilus sp.]|jgi:ABC-type multidrug transport system ATPase subunit